MKWSREDGIAGVEAVIIFSLLSILTFSAVPYYQNVLDHTQDVKIKATFSTIKATIMVARVDSITINGYSSVPDPLQVNIKNAGSWYDSKDWYKNSPGKWTYRPTGATIVYNKISTDDYSLVLNL